MTKKSETAWHYKEIEKFRKQFGDARLEKLIQTDSYFKKYWTPVIPKGFTWLWNHFLFIWENCERDFSGNPIFTFQTLNSYTECFGVVFSIVEKRLIFNMKTWAFSAIAELK